MIAATANLTGVVHQVVYRWTENSLIGSRGVGPVAASLPEPDLRAWNGRLGDEVWAAAEEPGSPPGLTYLLVGPHAVVLHKLAVPDPTGRSGSTLTHALIGPAGDPPVGIDPTTALGLLDWDGWHTPDRPEPAGGRLDLLAIEHLLDAAERGLTRLRRVARRIAPGPVEELVDQVLADPDAEWSVLPAPTPSEHLLCAVTDVVGHIGGPWTFASRESADDGANRPRRIFLVAPQTGAPTRPRIALAGWPAAGGGVRQVFVTAVVDAYRRSGHAALARIRPSSPPTRPKEIAAWMQQVQLAPGVLNDPYGLLIRAAVVDLSDAEAEFLQQRRSVQRVASILPTLPDAALHRVLDRWTTGSRERAGRGDLRWPPLARAVRTEALQRAFTPGAAELVAAVAALRPEPAEIRQVLVGRLRSASADAEPAVRAEYMHGLLCMAADLGMPLNPAGDAESMVLDPYPTPDLLDGLDRLSWQHLGFAGLLLETVLCRRIPAGSVDGWWDHLARRSLHLDSLERLCAHDSQRVAELLLRLLRHLLGPALGVGEYGRRVTELFRGEPPATVIGALRMAATTPAALAFADHLAVARFYRDHGMERVPRAGSLEPEPGDAGTPGGDTRAAVGVMGGRHRWWWARVGGWFGRLRLRSTR